MPSRSHPGRRVSVRTARVFGAAIRGPVVRVAAAPGLARPRVNPQVDLETNPCADDTGALQGHAPSMTTADYILGLSALGLIVWNMRRHVLTDRRLLRPL